MDQETAIKSLMSMSFRVIRTFDWLLDMYVLDFFVDDHWDKMPASWKASFENIDPQKLGSVLCGRQSNHVFPLSFIALVQTVKALGIPRNINKIGVHEPQHGFSCDGHPRLNNLFLKHVKFKKRHEISLMAEVVKNTAVKSKCNAVIDFGSGLGHLVRVLAYKYNFYAAGIECQSQLTEEARKLDRELEYTARKHLSEESMAKLHSPVHLNITLSHHHQLSNVSLPSAIAKFGLIGLHPCGDLGPLLLKHFMDNDRVKFICLVGCCYMKLTCDGNDRGYPMSEYVKGLKINSKLSYVSREMACHAIETYSQRLLEGNYEDLKIHAYRAALESMLVDINPELKHSPIRSIKHSDSMTFEKYCSLALERLHISLPSSGRLARGEEQVGQWRRVVTTFTLRLVLAPLVETVILLDRMLYVIEKGMFCEIRPVFDPVLSPRNHIMIARR